ncbi:hypothetical protein, partial [Paenibacillus cremeus]|uniref:hypothetical protein n=1 Tax=Paenibacillus cremeus TaxID=2163881 RepID=UPI001C9820FD
ASCFLQIPPHGGHLCSWLTVGVRQPPFGTHTLEMTPMLGVQAQKRDGRFRRVFCMNYFTVLPVNNLIGWTVNVFSAPPRNYKVPLFLTRENNPLKKPQGLRGQDPI